MKTELAYTMIISKKLKEDRVTRFVSEIAKIQKEGSLAESATDVNYHTARKIS